MTTIALLVIAHHEGRDYVLKSYKDRGNFPVFSGGHDPALVRDSVRGLHLCVEDGSALDASNVEVFFYGEYCVVGPLPAEMSNISTDRDHAFLEYHHLHADARYALEVWRSRVKQPVEEAA